MHAAHCQGTGRERVCLSRGCLAIGILLSLALEGGCRTPSPRTTDGASSGLRQASAAGAGPTEGHSGVQTAVAPPHQIVRHAAVAGSWYPGDRETLAREIDGMLAQAQAPSAQGRHVVAMVSPHAGYRFSGRAAAAGYARLRGERIARVVVVGPSHHAYYRGVAVTRATHYETPLGLIPVDRTACDALIASGAPFVVRPEAERREHSLEMQLPMLQRVLGSFVLIPLIVGEMTPEDYEKGAKALRQLLGPDTLIVASSDFTHRGQGYGYEPFPSVRGNPAALKEKVRELDMGAVQEIRALRRSAFEQYLERTGATVCGARPIALLIETLLPRQPLETDVAAYYTSGDVLGDWSSSVSYASIVFYAKGPRPKPLEASVAKDAPVAQQALSGQVPGQVPLSPQEGLSDDEKKTLRVLARRSLESAVRQGSASVALAEGLPLTPRLRKPGAAFVTLKIRGELRGCIGTLQAHRPLYEDVIENALNAALHDSRFDRVRPEELPSIEIEISVLTTPREVSGPQEIVVGKHGIILEKYGRRATFLPQVAPEQGWDRDTTLSHLARKAGLPADAWREGARFWVYEAIVF